MNDLFKNPFVVLVLLVAGLVGLNLVFKLISSLFWLIILAVIVLFIINKRFRSGAMKIVRRIFVKD